MTYLRHEPATLFTIILAALVVSGISPNDRITWWLEVAPILVALPLLLFTYTGFRLTPLSYRLITLHALILCLGAHYTYAQVPPGFWLQELFDLQRNHYDRLGHLAQGFIPAIIVREILLRRSPLQRGKWLFSIVTCVCLAISAFYELTEWWVALLSEEASISFLATQGDVWDTQWDMFLALVGALCAQWLLAARHDRMLTQMNQGATPRADSP